MRQQVHACLSRRVKIALRVKTCQTRDSWHRQRFLKLNKFQKEK